jgi:integrase
MSARTPSYCRHKASGQAVVRIGGKDFYLGTYGSSASRQEYDRLLAEWLGNGRCLPAAMAPAGLSVSELLLAYWRFAEGYYGSDGKRTGHCLWDAMRIVKQLYGGSPAAGFKPLALKAVRQKMIDKGWSRTYINSQVDRLRRMFRWAAEEELLPAAVYQDLRAVTSLRYGKTAARETARVRPVAQEMVEATLPHLRPTVQAMARLQGLVGCRPTEVCLLRPMDLDMSNPQCWVYRPGSDYGAHGQHKTAHHGHDRLILIGPRAQEVLLPYLGTKLDAYCFSPAASEEVRHAEQHRARKTPLTPSQAKRKRKAKPARPKRDHYDKTSYRNAVYRACDRAFPLPEQLAPRRLEGRKVESRATWRARLTAEEKGEVRAWRRAHRWHPNRLRHSRATQLRGHGLDVVKTILGHSRLETTQVYSEKDLAAAVELVSKIG